MAKKITLALGILSLIATMPNAGFAQAPAKNMTVKVSESKNGRGTYSKLKDVLQTAGFGNALGEGRYTIFAPTNSAFARLSQDRLSDLLRPENRNQLKSIMARHVVAGNVSFDELKQAINDGNGSTTLKTLAGDSLTFRQTGSRILVSDQRGHVSAVTNSNLHQGSSTIYSVDTILL